MKKTTKVVEVVDDFDGSPADQTVRFAFNGASYEIDLNREHFEEFAEAIQPYIKAGRKVGSTAAAAMRVTRTSASRTRRFARGRSHRAWRFLIAVVFPPRSSRPTARRTPDRYTIIGGCRITCTPRLVLLSQSPIETSLFAPMSLTWGRCPSCT